ncbi:MAG: alpha/beta hydrolase [Anaerolineae bacterium]|nr:alpha/beta hydrolase [Anaerolineae bacterium]
MPHAPVNGIQMYYEEHGSGIPLVLIHGFMGSGKVWEKIIPALMPRYRLIVPDLRAHGRSTGTRETIHHSYFAEDLVGLLDYLSIPRAHFIGSSSGGMSLLYIGTRHQERIRTLTLACATHTFDDHAKPLMRKHADESESHHPTEADRQMHGPYYKELLDAFRGFTMDPPELPFTPEDLRAITRPVLVLHGDRDTLFPVYIPVTMYQAMLNAELCILPNCGHSLPGQYTDLFLVVTTQFLERHAEA